MQEPKSKNFIEFNDLEPEELQSFNKILHNIWRRRGVDFRQYRPRCLRRRVVVGMHDANVETFTQYLKFLKANPQSYDELLDRITINVSEFFRNPETFSAVRKIVIPEIIKRKQNISSHIIRVWSCGCATGEEPYSLSIIFREVFSELAPNFSVTILATDLDKEAIKRAQEGVYKGKNIRELKHSQCKQYFERLDDDRYKINHDIKAAVKFRHHNMITDEPLNRIDLIFCRNVIIYFTKDLQKKVYENFYKALSPEGFFVGGKTESLMDISFDRFERIDLNERILKKKKEN